MRAAGQIASFNRGRLVADWDDPAVAGFTGNLDRVNALAEQSPGFVWRMGAEEMEAAQMGAALGPDPRLASTLAVWESVEVLRHFVFATLHGRFVARRHEWFEKSSAPAHVMWRIPAGHRPAIAEAVERIERLERDGAGPEAFDWTYAAEHASAPAA